MVFVVHRILGLFKGLSGVSKGFDVWTRMKTCMKTIKLPIASNCNNSGLAKNQDPGWPRILMKHAWFLACVYMHIQQCQKTSKQPVRILVSTWVDVCLDIPHRKHIYIYIIFKCLLQVWMNYNSRCNFTIPWCWVGVTNSKWLNFSGLWITRIDPYVTMIIYIFWQSNPDVIYHD